MRKQNKKHQKTRFIDENLKNKSLVFFLSFFHVIHKISNFFEYVNRSWTELTLK